MNTETIDIGELANNLSNNQICELLNRVGSRLDIYYGLHNMCCTGRGTKATHPGRIRQGRRGFAAPGLFIPPGNNQPQTDLAQCSRGG